MPTINPQKGHTGPAELNPAPRKTMLGEAPAGRKSAPGAPPTQSTPLSPIPDDLSIPLFLQRTPAAAQAAAKSATPATPAAAQSTSAAPAAVTPPAAPKPPTTQVDQSVRPDNGGIPERGARQQPGQAPDGANVSDPDAETATVSVAFASSSARAAGSCPSDAGAVQAVSDSDTTALAGLVAAASPTLTSTTTPFVAPKPTAPRPVFDNIPDELTVIPNWIDWRYMPPTSGPKWRKIPFQVNGKPADTTDPSTWTSFEATCAKYEAGGYAGIGFVFDGTIGEDGLCYVGIDLDGCIVDGVLQEPARSQIKQLNTYTELSPSGTGVHIIVRAKPLRAYKSGDSKVEVYCDKRYFTFTGQTLATFTQIKAAPEAVEALINEARAKDGKQTATASATSKTNNVINLANFKNGPAAAFRGHETDELLSDGLAADIEEIRSAAVFIPASAISAEGEWMNVARALAHEAAINNPDQTEELYEILDEVSKTAPGYNKEENRSRFDRYMNEAGTHPTPRTIATIFDLARKHGWQGQDLPAAAPTSIPQTAQLPTKLMQTSAAFIANYIPPEYLIDGFLQRRFIYSFTGPTGSGKTSIVLLLAIHVALGLPLAGKEVEGGRVLMFAGENPDDVRARWIKLCEVMGYEPDKLDVVFMPFTLNLSAETIRKRIDAEAAEHGPFSLLIVDTSASYYSGNDENDNVALGNHARMLRTFTELPGGPTILVTCHPTKNPDMANLLPRGGGAFLAEVDGNLVCVKDPNMMTVEITTHGKFRGPDFASFSFRLEAGTSEKLVDAKGRSIWSVYAKEISTAEQEDIEQQGVKNQNELLRIMLDFPDEPLSSWAERLGWKSNDDSPNKMRVQRALKILQKAKLVEQVRAGAPYTLTKKGEKTIEVKKAPAKTEIVGG